MRLWHIQASISIIAFGFILIHTLFPQLTVDSITITLLIIAIIPWLIPLFKSIETPSGWKFELQDLIDTGEKADKIGLLSKKVSKNVDYSFQRVIDEDPNLGLAGLRIEIENRVKKIAEMNNIQTKNKGIGRLLNELEDKQTFTQNEVSVLRDLVALLNSAVHGATVDCRAVQWVKDIGPRLIEGLDEKIDRN